MSRISKDGKECNFSSKCPKCGGRLGAQGSRLSKRWGVVTRIRVCTQCKYKFQTAEVDFEDFRRQEGLIKALESAISVYLENKTPTQKKCEE